MRGTGRRWVAGLVAVVALGSALLVGARIAQAHSGDVIQAAWAVTIPTIDGAMTTGEWADAELVDLGAIPGNYMAASLLIKNNDTFLWVAYDATGDRSTSPEDTASFALDTGHDGVATNGGEDQFVMGGWIGNTTGHFVYSLSNGSWVVQDSPFNPSLPRHAGLAGVWGFGPSDLGATGHRIYEFRIPLLLVGASAGDILGLFGGSQPAPGVTDDSGGYDTWPKYVGGPIPISQYGDLDLALPPGPVGVSLSPASATGFGDAGTSVSYGMTVRNRGTNAGDTFDLTSITAWPVTFWDATGTVPLADTDADGTPDTGNLTGGTSVSIVVKVDIPPATTGCRNSTVVATSSLNTAFRDSSLLLTCTAAASFAPPYWDLGVDTNGNGFYDYLEVHVNINVAQTDYYGVVGSLMDATNTTTIDQQLASFFGTPGTWNVTLTFSGNAIFRSASDGPYPINLWLINGIGQRIDQDTYLSGPYAYTQFEPPAAAFAPPHSDRGVDTDVPPNGLYDYLEVDASVSVNSPGFYFIASAAYDPNGTFLGTAQAFAPLSSGLQTIPVQYPSRTFTQFGLDGPYTIDLSLYDQFGSFLDGDTYVTGPYRASDFDPLPIAFAPPHSDRGVDADIPPDGKFDWLVVSASVRVGEAGDFVVQGYLYGPGGFPPITSVAVNATLGVGPATVDLNFAGSAIYRAGISGNFDVELLAWSLSSNNSSVNDRYTTNLYSYSDFQPPGALFSPPHSDHGVDVSTPPDGKFDWLEVDASVSVSKAGPYRVAADLRDYYGIPMGTTTGSATLLAGLGAIPLRFDGHLIAERAQASPFFVSMVLYDASGTQLDYTQYNTGSYTPSQFQPPDASVPASSASSSGYWRNGAPVRIAYVATDPAPSDGIASVSLYSRYSPNNATWFPWAESDSKSFVTPGRSQAAGDFLNDLPAGEGYYQFYTIATDFAGNVETAPSSADIAIAAFLPATLVATPASGTLVAGGSQSFSVRVTNAAGQPVVLAADMTVALGTTSLAGTFTAGSPNPITALTIPAGASQASFDYHDTITGAQRLTLSAGGIASATVPVTVSPASAATIGLSPGNAAVAVTGAVTFAATVRDAYGNVIGTAPLAWSAAGGIGSINSGGVFTAGTRAGAGTVTVESGGLIANADVFVRPGPIDHVQVLAESDSVAVGSRVVVHAFAADLYENVIPDATFAWTVEGPATLSANSGGQVTVTATGEGAIHVTASSGTPSKTLALTAGAPTTPPGGGSAPVLVGVGGVIAGLLGGFGIGWIVSRRRRREDPESPPKEGES